MSAPFDNIVQKIHSFRPATIEGQQPPWVKILLNPLPPKTDLNARALYSKYALDFHAPRELPAMIEGALCDHILILLSVLSVLRYKKVLADLDKSELEDLLDVADAAGDIYLAHRTLLSVIRAEYEYLIENETGVDVV